MEGLWLASGQSNSMVNMSTKSEYVVSSIREAVMYLAGTWKCAPVFGIKY